MWQLLLLFFTDCLFVAPMIDTLYKVAGNSSYFEKKLLFISLGEPYSSSWSPSWQYLYTLVNEHINDGTFTFNPKPAAVEHRVFEFGSLRIVPSKYNDGEW